MRSVIQKSSRPLLVTGLMILGASVLGASVAMAGPVAYTVNSDGDSNADSLYAIDLETGEAERIGATGFADIEGLAFSSDGILFGADDATNTLLTIDLATGQGLAVDGRFRNLDLGDGPSSFDFGLTFTCEGQLVMSSDTENLLYSVDAETGVSLPMADQGGTGAPITGLASYADTVYGIGSMGSESLYRVDPETGTTELIGPLGADISFNDGGLAFDEEGTLWAVADLSDQGFLPTPIYRIDVETGAATWVADTIVGLESLAIGPAGPCDVEGSPMVIPTLSLRGLALLVALVGLPGILALRRRV